MSNIDDEGKGADTGSEPITIRVRDQVSGSDRMLLDPVYVNVGQCAPRAGPIRQ
jgi:hypothetical protein